jgi:hypothetical protein
MFSRPFGPYGEALGSMFGSNHQVSLVFQRAARAILNRGFAAEDLLSNHFGCGLPRRDLL